MLAAGGIIETEDGFSAAATVPTETAADIPAVEAEPDTETKNIELIALATVAEAEGESEEGKRLVIDTILNRVDHGSFPDTVHGVIYEPNQFSVTANGRMDRVRADAETVRLVREELESRTDYDVVFFRAGRYGKYGKPLFRVGNHYFSGYGN
jgi:N-acetylmuramoyl-L-alanine amidase